MSVIIRQTHWTIVPEGEPLYSEEATEVRIVDEAGGEFVEITQHDGGKVRLDWEDWRLVRDAADAAFALIEMHEQRRKAREAKP